MHEIAIAILAGLTGMLGWGISDFFAKKSVNKIGVLKTLAAAQALGAAVFISIFFLAKKNIPSVTQWDLFFLLLHGLVYTSMYLLLYRAFKKGLVSVVSPIGASGGGLAVLVSVIIFNKTLSATNIIGIFLISVGVLIFLSHLVFQKKTTKNFNLGIPEAMGSMLILSFWAPFWNRFIWGENWLFWLMGLRIIVASTVFTFYLLVKKKNEHTVKAYSSGYRGIILIALFDILAYLGVSWGWGTTITPHFINLIGTLTSISPLPTVILGYVLLKERMNIIQLIAITALLIGIFTCSF